VAGSTAGVAANTIGLCSASEDHGAVDHLDMWSGSTLFRVFLLSSSMQVDLSFWPWETFAPSGASFLHSRV